MTVKLPKTDDWIVDEIKDALRAAPDIASVNATVRHFAKNVLAMERSRVELDRDMAAQIKNLA